MTQDSQPEQSTKRSITIELSWRNIGYGVAMFLFIFVLGMQTYSLLPYPALWAFALLGIGIVLLILTAPALRKK